MAKEIDLGLPNTSPLKDTLEGIAPVPPQVGSITQSGDMSCDEIDFVPSPKEFDLNLTYANTTITNIYTAIVENITNILTEIQLTINETYNEFYTNIVNVTYENYEFITSIYHTVLLEIANITSSTQESINTYNTYLYPSAEVIPPYPVTTPPVQACPPPPPCPVPKPKDEIPLPEKKPEPDACDVDNDPYFWETDCGQSVAYQTVAVLGLSEAGADENSTFPEVLRQKIPGLFGPAGNISDEQ